jgi:hypothetical protein
MFPPARTRPAAAAADAMRLLLSESHGDEDWRRQPANHAGTLALPRCSGTKKAQLAQRQAAPGATCPR